MYMRDNLAKDAKQVQNIAARKAAERFKDCLQYTLTVRGHRDPVTNRMYTPNTVIGVYDELCDIEERLWVEKCTYTYSPGEGAKTQLVCWRPNSFGIGVDQ
jgi:prophage tail gpP-like protein